MSQPHAHELLEIARLTLLEQLLPALPGGLRYPARMIANAMAIAARESCLHAHARRQELALLSTLTGDTQAPLHEARLQLARDIRQGRHDSVQNQRSLTRALRQMALARLAISNPKAVP